MSLTEEMDLDTLQNTVIRRNLAMDALKSSLKELKKNKIELDGIASDGCHAGTDLYIRHEYARIIKEIEDLIRHMDHGDWCFSVDSTAKREEEMDDE